MFNKIEYTDSGIVISTTIMTIRPQHISINNKSSIIIGCKVKIEEFEAPEQQHKTTSWIIPT